MTFAKTTEFYSLPFSFLFLLLLIPMNKMDPNPILFVSSCGLPRPWEWAEGGAAVGKWARKPLMGTIQLPCGGNRYDDIITIIQALWNRLTIFSFSGWVHMSGSESLDYLKSVGKYSVSSWKIYIIARFWGNRVFKIKINTHIL